MRVMNQRRAVLILRRAEIYLNYALKVDFRGLRCAVMVLVRSAVVRLL